MSAGKNLRTIARRNMSSLMMVLIVRKSCSRKQLAEELGLTKMTVTNIVTQLKEMGYLVEETTKEMSTAIGPKPASIRIMPRSILAVGVHISSTLITAQIVDIVDGVLYEKVEPVDTLESKQELLQRIRDLLDRLFEDTKVYREKLVGIGVTYTGFVDRRSGKIIVRNDNIHNEEVNIRTILERRYELPVTVASEVEGAVLAEIVFGKIAEYRKFYYINISDQIRGGFVGSFQLHYSEYGMSGEIGHMSIKYDGPLCTCGSRGCYQLFASIPVLLEESKSHSLQELVLKTQERDPLALRVIDEFVQASSALFVNLVNIYDPEVLLIGGEITLLGPAIFHRMEQLINERIIYRKDRYIKVRCSNVKERANTIGAALTMFETIGNELC